MIQQNVADETKTFSAVRLRLIRPEGVAIIDWPQPQVISVSFFIPANSIEQFKRVWTISYDVEAVKMQTLVTSAPRIPSTATAPDCVLELRPRQTASASAVSWSLKNESDQLRQLRVALQNLSHVQLVEALAHLQRGRDWAASGHLDAAIEAYEHGIESLGAAYSTPDLVDDTEMKLILARSAKEKGNRAQAAALLERALEARTQAYAERFHLKN